MNIKILSYCSPKKVSKGYLLIKLFWNLNFNKTENSVKKEYLEYVSPIKSIIKTNNKSISTKEYVFWKIIEKIKEIKELTPKIAIILTKK